MSLTRTGQHGNHPPTNHRPRKGFTLIELLVVIAIMSLLLAILTPALNLELAHATVCRSNLHQMGVAMEQYKSVYHFFPPGHSWSPIQPSNVITWAPNLRMYASGKEKLFHCPSAPEIAKWKVGSGSGLPAKWGYADDETRLYWNTPFSYGHNNWGTADFAHPQVGLGSMADWVPELLGSNANRLKDWGPLREHRVQAPWDMLAIGDSKVDGIWDAFIDHNQPGEFPYDTHLDRANILFCDGAVSPEYTIDLIDPTHTNPAARRRWNNDNEPH